MKSSVEPFTILLSLDKTHLSTGSSFAGFSRLYSLRCMKANLDAFHIFVMNLLPVTRSFSWKGMSSPSLEPAAQYLNASAEYFFIISRGSTTFPFDLDIFFPCGSSAHPEIITLCQGI